MLQKRNPNYTLVATMTDMQKSAQVWSGETGMIDAKMLAKYAKDTKNGVFYITGPPAMVKGLQAVLAGIRVHKDDVRVEEYTGY